MTQPTFDTLEGKKLPANPNAAMIEMMYIIDNFRSLMIKETEALEGADAAQFMSLQDEKILTAKAYQMGIDQLLSRKEELRAADPALRQRLEKMQEGFHAVTRRNLDGLERMKSGTLRLHEKIMMAARDTAMNETRFAYGATGTMRDGGKVSIGLSEQA